MFQRQQRYLDELNRTMLITALVLTIIGMFFFEFGTWPRYVFSAISAALLILLVVRMTSRNQTKRNQENIRFLTAVTAVPEPASYAMLLIPIIRNRIQICLFWHCLVESCIKDSNMRNRRHQQTGSLDTINIRRIMQWGKMLNILDGLKHIIVNQNRLGEFFTTMDNSVPNG